MIRSPSQDLPGPSAPGQNRSPLISGHLLQPPQPPIDQADGVWGGAQGKVLRGELGQNLRGLRSPLTVGSSQEGLCSLRWITVIAV